MATDSARLWHDAAAAYHRGNIDKALKLLRSLAAKDRGHADARYLLGLCHYRQGDYAGAERQLLAALALRPTMAMALLDAGRLMREMDRADEAAAFFRRAMAADPKLTDAATELARLELARGRADEAAAALKGAEGGADADAALLAGLLALARGDFAAGWRGFARRGQASADMMALTRRDFGLFALPPDFVPPMPVWVWPEQGLGDEILMATVLPDALRLGFKIKLGCHSRLLPLYRRSFPDITLVPIDAVTAKDVADCRFQIALGDLMARLRPDFAAFGTGAPFLRPDPAQRDALRDAYRQRFPGRRLVGLSWGSRNSRKAARKSIPLAALAPVLALPDMAFIDLQYGDTAADLASLGPGAPPIWRDPAIDPLGPLDPYAAQIAALDAVVTISNTAAHLAGGLGVPTALLLPEDDGLLWYWFRERETSPWYGSLHLLRQEKPGAWEGVVARAAALLPALASGRAGS